MRGRDIYSAVATIAETIQKTQQEVKRPNE
jgi:hypothetical protein